MFAEEYNGESGGGGGGGGGSASISPDSNVSYESEDTIALTCEGSMEDMCRSCEGMDEGTDVAKLRALFAFKYANGAVLCSFKKEVIGAVIGTIAGNAGSSSCYPCTIKSPKSYYCLYY